VLAITARQTNNWFLNSRPLLSIAVVSTVRMGSVIVVNMQRTQCIPISKGPLETHEHLVYDAINELATIRRWWMAPRFGFVTRVRHLPRDSPKSALTAGAGCSRRSNFTGDSTSLIAIQDYN